MVVKIANIKISSRHQRLIWAMRMDHICMLKSCKCIVALQLLYKKTCCTAVQIHAISVATISVYTTKVWGSLVLHMVRTAKYSNSKT